MPDPTNNTPSAKAVLEQARDALIGFVTLADHALLTDGDTKALMRVRDLRDDGVAAVHNIRLVLAGGIK